MPPKTSSPLDWGITDAANYLGVHTDTVRRMIAQGELPAYRIGKRGIIRLRRKDVEAAARPMVSE